jgi:predicted DNA-binding transcriptional regulator AlpA
MLSEPLLSKQRVALLLDLHPASVMRLSRQGKFPKPFRTGGDRGSVRWRAEDVRDWINSRAA